MEAPLLGCRVGFRLIPPSAVLFTEKGGGGRHAGTSFAAMRALPLEDIQPVPYRR